MKKIFFPFFFFLLIAANVEAKYRQACTVQYMADYGWSKKYQVEVTFMTGYELNTATNSYRYNSNSVYAIIFWGQGQASVIKLSSYLICGFETDKSCITNAIGNLKGVDQDGDEWKICKDDLCF